MEGRTMAKQNESVDELYSFLEIENQKQEIRNTLNLGTLNKNLNTNRPTALNFDHRQMWNNSINMTR